MYLMQPSLKLLSLAIDMRYLDLRRADRVTVSHERQHSIVADYTVRAGWDE